MQMGLSRDDWEGKPVIAIINTWSDLSPCHHHLRDRAEWVRRGILQAGGMPAELPVHDFSEQLLKPPRCSIATWVRWRWRKPCALIRSTVPS